VTSLDTCSLSLRPRTKKTPTAITFCPLNFSASHSKSARHFFVIFVRAYAQSLMFPFRFNCEQTSVIILFYHRSGRPDTDKGFLVGSAALSPNNTQKRRWFLSGRMNRGIKFNRATLQIKYLSAIKLKSPAPRAQAAFALSRRKLASLIKPFPLVGPNVLHDLKLNK
jgi:hypothetical protein